MYRQIRVSSPYLRTGPDVKKGNFIVLSVIFPLVLFYAFKFNMVFLGRFSLYISAALLLEVLYNFLSVGKLKIRSAGSMVTASLLIMSLPVNMPLIPLYSALFISVFLIRMPVSRPKIVFNPVVAGRLFLMIFFSKEIVEWSLPAVDAVAAATPLELYKEEGEVFKAVQMLFSNFSGNWGGLYEITPGSPGDLLPVYTLFAGVMLFFAGVLEWRVPLFFILSFFLTMIFLNDAPVFQLLSGSVIFSAVFIAGDPKSTPFSKGGRIVAGMGAGIINALIRTYTYYSEGIVFSFLSMNLFAALFDQLAFYFRAKLIRKNHHKFAGDNDR